MFEFFNYYYYYLCGTKRSGSVYSSDRTRSSPQQPADRNQPAASTHSDITAHRADRDARGATRRKSLNQERRKICRFNFTWWRKTQRKCFSSFWKSAHKTQKTTRNKPEILIIHLIYISSDLNWKNKSKFNEAGKMWRSDQIRRAESSSCFFLFFFFKVKCLKKKCSFK